MLQKLALIPCYSNIPLYERLTSTGRGYGLRAMTQIPIGTPIISESELFSKVARKNVTQPQANKAKFKELSCPFEPETPDQRFEANSFSMGKDAKGNKLEGIFLEPCRLNHSCVPNAYVAWNPKLKRITVHAIIPIHTHRERDLHQLPLQRLP